MAVPQLPKIDMLPSSLPAENAVRIELVEGVPIFRTSTIVQERINRLLEKQQDAYLLPEEEQELDSYAEIDDYLSLLNRIVRNLYSAQSEKVS
jgi:hypothetical protein